MMSFFTTFDLSIYLDRNAYIYITPGLSSLGVPGVPWHTQILGDQLTLFQPGGTDYAHLITTGTPRFSDLPTALDIRCQKVEKTGFFRAKFFFHCTLSVILGLLHKDWFCPVTVYRAVGRSENLGVPVVIRWA